MTPTFRIVADGADITSKINDRLLLLRTSDKPGMESDEFELRIDDRDGQVQLPRRGSSIEIHLGYAETSLMRLGLYAVDTVEVSGPPDTIVIKGKASDMRGSGKTIRSGSWRMRRCRRSWPTSRLEMAGRQAVRWRRRSLGWISSTSPTLISSRVWLSNTTARPRSRMASCW